jgi:hypothetical protein
MQAIGPERIALRSDSRLGDHARFFANGERFAEALRAQALTAHTARGGPDLRANP